VSILKQVHTIKEDEPMVDPQLLNKVQRLEERVERLERLNISPSDLEEHLERLRQLEDFTNRLNDYLDRLERLSGPLTRLEERLDRLEGLQPTTSTQKSSLPRLIQSKVEAKDFLARLMRATSNPKHRSSLGKTKKRGWWWLLGRNRRAETEEQI